MTASDTTHRAYTVDLFGTTYEIDLDNELQTAFATSTHDVDSARRRLEAELTRIKTDAQRALDELHDGHRVNPLGPIQSENLVASLRRRIRRQSGPRPRPPAPVRSAAIGIDGKDARPVTLRERPRR